MHVTVHSSPSKISNHKSGCSNGNPVKARARAIASLLGLCAHHFEAPDGPESLKGPKGSADNVDDAGECVAAKGLDAADEAGVTPVVGEGQRRRDGRPDTKDDVHAEKDKEDGVCERAVLDCRIVHTHVPAQNIASCQVWDLVHPSF